MTSIPKSKACVIAIAVALAAAGNAAAHDLPAAPARGQLHGIPDIAPSIAPRLIVKFKPGSAAARDRSRVGASLTAAANRGTTQRARPLQLQALRRSATGAEIVQASRPLGATEAQALLQQLRADPDVQYAQLDTMKYALQRMPNDPQLPIYQWDLLETVGGIHAPTAWTDSTGEGVVVAVLDTGSTPHVDLKDNLLPGYDFISAFGQDSGRPDIAGDGDGRDADPTDPGDWVDASMGWCARTGSSSWHGTHVAGTVAAVTDNGLGVAGTAWGAKVQPVRVLGHCGGLTSDIAEAIIWAAGGSVPGVPDNPTPADVINLSLGGRGACSEDADTQAAIDMAVNRGTTVVVAAGNNGADAAGYSPASCNHVITVAATGITGAMASYSNHGRRITLAAPGGDYAPAAGRSAGMVWSTSNDGATVATTDILRGLEGTSMAAPHVAGIVALMQSAVVGAGQEPMTPAEISDILVASARPFPVGLPSGRQLGAGIADANRAVQLALGRPLPEIPVPLLPLDTTTAIADGPAGGSVLLRLEVPVGTRTLNLRTYGGRGDVSLLASAGEQPTDTNAQFRSTRPGTSETIVITQPRAGTWYLRVSSVTAHSGVNVLALAR